MPWFVLKKWEFWPENNKWENRGIQACLVDLEMTSKWPRNDPRMTYLAMTMTTTTIRYVFHCQFLFWGDRIEPELIFCSVKYLKLKTLFLTESGLIPIQIKTSSFSTTTFCSNHRTLSRISYPLYVWMSFPLIWSHDPGFYKIEQVLINSHGWVFH